ncbi:MAG: type II secretion system F family protein [Candidatus Desulforudis sp.]|nr:type II secretion system F family protein [Desulforudis sp.]
MYYTQIFLIGFITFAGVLLLNTLTVDSRAIVRQRLAAIARIRGVAIVEGDPFSLPFRERVIRPFLEKCGRLVGRLAPRAVHLSIAHRLMQAGHPYRLQTTTFLAILALSTIILPGLTVFVGLMLGLPVRNVAGWVMLALFVGPLVPWFWLGRKATERIQAIDRALPDAVDLLVVSVEAGLAFDMALAKVTEKMTGPLPDEFARTLNEIRLGKMRRHALRDMGQRVGAKSLSQFISTVIQSTQMGVSLGNILRIQSEKIRQERRMRASEMAMKAPVKMLFPMIFFIFPALFVVLLGPAMMRIVDTFANM